MSIIKCPECNGDVSDKAKNCPHCGYELSFSDKNTSDDGWVMVENDNIAKNGNQNNKKGKSLTLSFIAGLCAVFLITSFVGFIIGIYDLVKNRNDGKSHKGSYFAIILFTVVFLFGSCGGVSEESTTTNENPTQTEVSISDSSESIKKEDAKEDTKKEKEEKTKKTKEPKPTEKPKPTKKPKTAKQIKQEYINSCKEYNYKKVLRNPKKYIGKRIKVRIQISSVHDKSFLNPTKYYFGNSESDYGWYGNQYAVYDKRISKKLKLLESDIIEVYGEIIEPEETTSLIVNSTELFTIDMKYVKLIKE